MANLKDLIVSGSSRFISDVFADTVTATKFVTSGGTATQYVKGTGDLGNTSEFATSTQGGYASTIIENYLKAGESSGSITLPEFNPVNDTVHLSPQSLGTSQQTQARANINAQETLSSGITIKTINNNSILGSGNMSVQETLVSGVNIATINNQSLLEGGNIVIQGGGGVGTVGTLNTTATTAQATSSSESFGGSITLHKVSKTGSYDDLLNKPTIPTDSGLVHLAGAETITGTKTFDGANLTFKGPTNGDSAYIYFQHGVANDTYSDWKLYTHSQAGATANDSFRIDRILSNTTRNFLKISGNGTEIFQNIILKTDATGYFNVSINLDTKYIEGQDEYGNIWFGDETNYMPIVIDGVYTPNNSSSVYDTYVASKGYVDGLVGDIETLLAAI